MRSSITSLIILIATSGCWATFPIPYLQFGVRTPQQYFYHPPQRQFPPQPFFPNYEPFRYPQIYPQPQLYAHPQPFVPSQPYAHAQAYPFNFYNNPQALPRDTFPPVFADQYEPALQYYHGQLVVQPSAGYIRKPLLPQKLLIPNILADCNNVGNQQTELKKIIQKVKLSAMLQEVRRMCMDSVRKMIDTKTPILEETIPVEVTTKSPSTENQITPIKSAILLETPAEEVATKLPNSKEQPTVTNSAIPLEAISSADILQSTISEVKSTSMETTNSQDATSAQVPTKTSDSEPQKLIETTVMKESILDIPKMASTEIKAVVTEKTSQDIQDVIVEPTLNKESDAILSNAGIANKVATTVANL